MKANQIIHRNYICRLVLDMSNSMMAPLKVGDKLSKWIEKPITDNKYALPMYEIPDGNYLQKYTIPNPVEKDAENIILFLSDIINEGEEIPDGGIAFIDVDTGELVPTNWDLGESEEWDEIVDKLNKEGESLHTFSATDAVIELKKTLSTVNLQSLSWEGGLEESRKNSTNHIFEGEEDFIQNVIKCIEWYKILPKFAKTLNSIDLQKELLQVISVEERRQY